MKPRFLVPLVSLILISTLLVSGCRSAYYSTMETFGVYKRDILKKKVIAARDGQKEASEQFKDAMTRLKELYGFQGGNLEKLYNELSGDYDRSNSKAEEVHKRIKEMESVAYDLFAEWEKEIKQISSENLRNSSRSQLKQTRDKFEELDRALKSAEASMDPVLVKLRDNVLYLKHNLNAQAIGSLQGEAKSIQNDISKLIADMNASIAHADEFVKSMQ